VTSAYPEESRRSDQDDLHEGKERACSSKLLDRARFLWPTMEDDVVTISSLAHDFGAGYVAPGDKSA
jgi:hypothetical protein